MALPHKHGNLITAHTDKSKLFTGYVLLCSGLYIFNITDFVSKDNEKALPDFQAGLVIKTIST